MRSSLTSFFKVSSLLAAAGVLALTTASAKDPAAVDVKGAGKAAAKSAASVMPECLAKLQLTEEQQKQVADIISESSGAHARMWAQFSERYVQMIAAESAMLAAIEDNLTEQQQAQVRTHRRKTAHQGRTVVTTTTTTTTEAGATDAATSTAKPTTDVEGDLAKEGVMLTPEQAEASDKVQEMYHSNLHVLHREIQDLHARLLALEADKLVEFEKILTKAQFAQLRKQRSEAPAPLKLAKIVAQPSKAE